ncbi:MAG: type I-U CRISPR-associated protein Cas5/Cas6 [Labilithrix sp.]|nr:type I-U CRISPR-associated protein Cas5/Cas6 [Labilithrix sp.]
MLALEVALLTGRYVATAFDDRGRAEWPPHPARLFSALAATHFEALERSATERAALEWLEALGAPDVLASEASQRDIATVFVPVNDTSVVASLDDEAKAVDDARDALAAARASGAKGIATLEKKLAKAETRFSDALKRAVEPVAAGKEGKDGPHRAASLLPDRRTRQPRTFPSVTPSDPRIVFAWPKAAPSEEQRALLDALAARVVRLGHSSSLVAVRVKLDAVAAESPRWIPDETGELREPEDEATLRVVESGQLAALDATFERQADVPGRVMPASFQRYVRPATTHDERAPTTAFGQDWIVLGRVNEPRYPSPRLPSTRVVDIARSLRSALLKSFGANAPEVLSGHRAPGERSERAHLAIVPLPFVGHERADGSILGVALVVPSDASRDERHAIYRAVDSWRRGLERREDADAQRLPVHLGRAGILHLAVLEDEASNATLLPRTWCKRSRRWSSATPVALDRNPGDLRSPDPRKQARAYEEAEETIATACQHIGLPRPALVTAMASAPLAGGDKTRQFSPYATGKPPIQRVLLHATLTFDSPVEGPILLGSGRYLGLGLFRPSRDHG